MSRPSLGREYFARIYAGSPDPWDFATSPYERAKYAATIDALDGRAFEAGLEIGCSIGVLTESLAPRCAGLLAIDIDEAALAAARARCARLANVSFESMVFPRERPTNDFDLIVISEVAYYWSDDDLATAIDFAAARSGTVVELVHFLPRVEAYVRDGDDVHETFLRDPRFESIRSKREERFRIDVLRVR